MNNQLASRKHVMLSELQLMASLQPTLHKKKLARKQSNGNGGVWKRFSCSSCAKESLSTERNNTLHFFCASKAAFSSASLSVISQVSSSVRVLFFLLADTFFSISLIAFLISLGSVMALLTSILFPDPSNTSSGPSTFSISSSSLISPSSRKRPAPVTSCFVMIHFCVQTLSVNSSLWLMIATPPWKASNPRTEAPRPSRSR